MLYKHIGVGFALLVQLYRAMRRPLIVERATGSDLHAFLYHSLPIKIKRQHWEIDRQNGK